MTFLSYSQNAEDVLLWRALGHIKNGFYIDVGANDPELHSVTKAFYDAGWWGINIEPMPSYHAVFAAQRPRDINLTVAAGDAEGTITLFEVPSMNGWASTDRAVADAHRADGYEVTETDVPLRLLKDICAEHVRGDIHFLKIDVEGFEEAVLRGMDFVRWRPWILVIEATLPNSRATNHDTWEALVTGHDYQFAYFDGLNRYYVAFEHRELLAALDVQPNVFDGFISHHLDKAWQRATLADEAVTQTQALLAQKEQQAQDLAGSVQRAQARAAELEQHAQDVARIVQRSEVRIAELDQQAQDLARAADKAEARAGVDAQRLAETDQRLQLALNLSDQLLRKADAETARAEEAGALAAAAAAQAHDEHVAAIALHAHVAHVEQQLQTAEAGAAQALAWAQGLERQVLAMQSSTSWRLTRPLRAVVTLGRSGDLPGKVRRTAITQLRKVLRRLAASQRARRLILPALKRFPALDARLTAAVARVKNTADTTAPLHHADVPAHLSELPVSTRKVLADLQRISAHLK